MTNALGTSHTLPPALVNSAGLELFSHITEEETGMARTTSHGQQHCSWNSLFGQLWPDHLQRSDLMKMRRCDLQSLTWAPLPQAVSSHQPSCCARGAARAWNRGARHRRPLLAEMGVNRGTDVYSRLCPLRGPRRVRT